MTQARSPAAAAAIDDKTVFTFVSLRLFRAAGIVAVLVLATALRAHGLVRQSAWADEITTFFIADPTATFWQFWQRVLSDTHPPLYYLLMREWFTAFGASDLSARLPSAIFGVLAVAAI
ncbi:MAG TPA: glycosyltransferase family 39 protein, partial [Stellaceae bacterium]|nr:glycosyltransferase family 39 protein [Stellaceae bacterium]